GRLRSEGLESFGLFPAATGECAGVRQDIYRAGLPEIPGAGGEPRGGGRFGKVASVSGGVYTGRGHQLELRGRWEPVVDRYPDFMSAAGESHRYGLEAGDALDLLRPRDVPALREGGRGGRTGR